jgi:hypothetical protein
MEPEAVHEVVVEECPAATVVLLVPPRGGSTATRERNDAVGLEFARAARCFLSEFAGASALASGCDAEEMISCLVAKPEGVAVAMPFVPTASVPAALRADAQLVACKITSLSREPPAVVASLSKVARLVSSERGPPGGCSLVILCASTFAINRRLSSALDALSALKIGVAWSHLYVDVESRLASAGASGFVLGGVDAQGIRFCRKLRQLLQTSSAFFEMRPLAAEEMTQCAHNALRRSRALAVPALLVRSGAATASTSVAGDDALAPLVLEVIPLQLPSRLHVEFGLHDAPHGPPLRLRIEMQHCTPLVSIDLALMRGSPHVVRARVSSSFVSSIERVGVLHRSLTRAKLALVVHVSAAGGGMRPHALLLPRAARPNELVLLFMACRDSFLDLPQRGAVATAAAASDEAGSGGGGDGGEADEQDRAEESESGAAWCQQLPRADFTPLRHSSGARAHALRPARQSPECESGSAVDTQRGPRSAAQQQKEGRREPEGGGGGVGGRRRARRL